MSIRVSKLGLDRVHVTSTYHNMGTLHHDLSDHQQAKGYYDSALSILLNEPSPDYLSVANSYHSMGTLQLALGNHEQA